MFKFFLLSFLSLNASGAELIVWNVGQGQWVSEIRRDVCLHYDMGGEKNPSLRVLKLCSEKKNFIHLSHWDWDHISFVRAFSSRVRFACLLPLASPSPSGNKKKLVENLPICNSENLKSLSIYERIIFHPSAAANSNESSEVIFSKQFSTVIPGDSPKKQEKIWAEELPSQVRGLILGHHGSRTSTSQKLLEHLNGLNWAVATARKARYGHPHREVVEALKKEKVPLLKTEDWGHLHFLKSEKEN